METNKEDIWEKIEKEKIIDNWLKRICIGSWFTTILLLLVYVFLIINHYIYIIGEGGFSTLVLYFPYEKWTTHLLTYTLIFFGASSITFSAAVLSTIGIFVRMRTSSLRDIQLRLGTLENAFLATKG